MFESASGLGLGNCPMLDCDCGDLMSTLSGNKKSENVLRCRHVKGFRDMVLITQLGEAEKTCSIIVRGSAWNN